jgi:23S rRNA-/tRNA-specific pseudouridylate synthase
VKQLEHAFTSKHWIWTYLEPGDCPSCLLDALKSRLTHLDPESWPKRFALGGVYVNGLPAAIDSGLTTPCKVEYYEPKFELSAADSFFPPFTSKQVVYEDADLLVAFKPAGLSCMPARDQNVFHLKAQIESYLGKTIHMPSRIDMSAQGLVVVSTSARMHKHLQHAYQFRRIEKKYLLRSNRKPEWDATSVEAPIGRDPEHPVLRKVDGRGALSALTHFRTLGSDIDGSTLLEAKPHTGRTHQIRVHAAHLGLPILGDKFYGGGPAPLLHLLSFSFKVWHPFTRQELSISVPQELLPSWVGRTADELSRL